MVLWEEYMIYFWHDIDMSNYFILFLYRYIMDMSMKKHRLRSIKQNGDK